MAGDYWMLFMHFLYAERGVHMLHEEEEKEKREADHRVPPHQVNFISVKKHPQRLSVNVLTYEFINP